MDRSELESQAGEQLSGCVGLWTAILLNILESAKDRRSPDHEATLRVIESREGSFDLISDAMGIEPEELQRRIIRSLRKGGRGV